MTYKLRALLFALAAVVFVAPAAFAADFVGGADVEVPPGASVVAVDIETDTDLRGVGFSVVMENIDAVSASIVGVTVNLTELGSRHVNGDIFLAGSLGGGDDLVAGAYPGAVTVDIDVQGVTGNTARLIVCGVNPWPDNPIFVGTEDSPTRRLLTCDTILITVKAGAAIVIDGICPDYAETHEDGAVAIQVTAQINDGVFQSLALIDVLMDGVPTAPTNTPDVTGLGLVDAPDATSLIMYWEPAAGEAGTWEFCFEATNDLGDADIQCVGIEVLVAGPDHMAWQSEHIEYVQGTGPFPYTMNLDFITSDNSQGVVGPFYVKALTGAGLDAQITVADAGFSADMAPFEQQSPQNPVYVFDGTLDAGRMGLIDFGGTELVPGTYPAAYFMNTTLKEAEGVIAIDSTDLPPANVLTYNQTIIATNTPTYSPGCYSVTIIRNIPPRVICPVTDAGSAIFGDLVSVPGFTCEDPDDSPQPCTFEVVSMEKDGAAADPTNAPGFDGDTFEWQTSNADDNDVGIWEFCVVANDGAGISTNECCFTVEVIAQVPLVGFVIGSNEAPTGTDLCVPLSIVNLACAPELCEELGGFDLLFTYDPTIVTFTGLDLDGSVLETAGWEYLTYRIEGMNPPLIRVVAIADMNNSNQHPNDWCIDGLLANICFRTTYDLDLGCQSAPIRFYWNDCGDNAASSRDGNTLYVVTDPFTGIPWCGGDPTAVPPVLGGGIIDNSESIFAQLFTGDGGIRGLRCLDPDPDPDKPTPEEYLYFVNGKIKITCPGDLDDRGDINLNAIAYEISDAVLYSNYFILGPSVFVVNVAGQTAASDVNADGTPLTVADLVYLIRVITGDAEPIAEDLLGGGPKVAAAVGHILVTSAQQGANVSVSVSSEHDMGAGLFVYTYEGMDIADVQAVGRASNMNVKYEAADGELRILVLPTMGSENIENSRVSAGTGEILSIATHGVGTVELVRVEAATFMGGTLDATVEAKVLPTAYALHQNYPNPFNPSTSLAIDFPNASEYTLTIYNIAGQVVKTFAGQAEAGTYTITWDGRDNRNSQVASGVYFYSVEAGEFADVRKMVLMK